MFLIDSICNYRSTEPIWFRFFRGFAAVILSLLIIYYSIIQTNQVDREISIITRSEQLKSKNKLIIDYILNF